MDYVERLDDRFELVVIPEGARWEEPCDCARLGRLRRCLGVARRCDCVPDDFAFRYMLVGRGGYPLITCPSREAALEFVERCPHTACLSREVVFELIEQLRAEGI